MTGGAIQFPRVNTPLSRATSSIGAYRILIRDLVLMASVGVYAHERDTPQPIQFNLDLKVCRGGTGLGVVDYQAIVTGITALMARGHIELVEEIGEQIIDFCLSDPRVEEITIRVEKLNAVKQTASVGIEMTRKSVR
jgi:dihydroneopterin aldolase